MSQPKLGNHFHTIDSQTGRIDRQGKIIKRHRGGWFTVQFYSWALGEPNGTDEVHASVICDPENPWRLYTFADQMRAAWEKEQRQKERSAAHTKSSAEQHADRLERSEQQSCARCALAFKTPEDAFEQGGKFYCLSCFEIVSEAR